jgi:hypothetical protein
MKKKTLLLLINNALTASFMRAWYCQNEDLYSEYNVIGVLNIANVIEWLYLKNRNSERLEDVFDEKFKLNQQVAKDALGDVVEEWIDCPPTRIIPFFPFRMSNLKINFKERKLRQSDLNYIRTIFSSTDILLKNIDEIWYGNGFFNRHFFFLCPKAIGKTFEHGIHETACFTQMNTPEYVGRLSRLPDFIIKSLRTIKRFHYNKIQEFFMYFSYETINERKCISLLAEEIKSCKPSNNKILHLTSQKYIHTLNQISTIPEIESYKQHGGNNAIILIENLADYPGELGGLQKFYKDFEDFILKKFTEILVRYEIENIFIKAPSYREEYSEICLNSLSQLKKEYNLFNLSQIKTKNFPIEFFLTVLKPKIFIHELSSSSFFVKKLDPSIQIHSYHQWYLDYLDEKRFSLEPDLYPNTKFVNAQRAWQVDFFHNKYFENFKHLVSEEH